MSMPGTSRAGKGENFCAWNPCRAWLEFLLECEGKLLLGRINVPSLGQESLEFGSAVPVQHHR